MNIAVEGDSDREAAKAVVRYAGHEVKTVRSAGGKTRLDPLIVKYCRASTQHPWVVFRDSDGDCPVDLVRKLLPNAAQDQGAFTLRIAHTMTESWLLADAESFADYFKVPDSRIPDSPDDLPNAKRVLLELCELSKSRQVRSTIVRVGPKPGSLYVSLINEFANHAWRPGVASERSESLRRAIHALRGVNS